MQKTSIVNPLAQGRCRRLTVSRWTLAASLRAGAVGLLISGLLVGCSPDQVVVWSASVRSPDGQWDAVGRTDQYAGPGNAAVVTAVYLRRAGSSGRDQLVLDFFDDFPPGKGGIDVAIKWVSAKHLQIVFRRPPNLNFELVRYQDIDISVGTVAS